MRIEITLKILARSRQWEHLIFLILPHFEQVTFWNELFQHFSLGLPAVLALSSLWCGQEDLAVWHHKRLKAHCTLLLGSALFLQSCTWLVVCVFDYGFDVWMRQSETLEWSYEVCQRSAKALLLRRSPAQRAIEPESPMLFEAKPTSRSPFMLGRACPSIEAPSSSMPCCNVRSHWITCCQGRTLHSLVLSGLVNRWDMRMPNQGCIAHTECNLTRTLISQWGHSWVCLRTQWHSSNEHMQFSHFTHPQTKMQLAFPYMLLSPNLWHEQWPREHKPPAPRKSVSEYWPRSELMFRRIQAIHCLGDPVTNTVSGAPLVVTSWKLIRSSRHDVQGCTCSSCAP